MKYNIPSVIKNTSNNTVHNTNPKLNYEFTHGEIKNTKQRVDCYNKLDMYSVLPTSLLGFIQQVLTFDNAFIMGGFPTALNHVTTLKERCEQQRAIGLTEVDNIFTDYAKHDTRDKHTPPFVKLCQSVQTDAWNAVTKLCKDIDIFVYCDEYYEMYHLIHNTFDNVIEVGNGDDKANQKFYVDLGDCHNGFEINIITISDRIPKNYCNVDNMLQTFDFNVCMTYIKSLNGSELVVNSDYDFVHFNKVLLNPRFKPFVTHYTIERFVKYHRRYMFKNGCYMINDGIRNAQQYSHFVVDQLLYKTCKIAYEQIDWDGGVVQKSTHKVAHEMEINRHLFHTSLANHSYKCIEQILMDIGKEDEQLLNTL